VKAQVKAQEVREPLPNQVLLGQHIFELQNCVIDEVIESRPVTIYRSMFCTRCGARMNSPRGQAVCTGRAGE
jgi:hypothetical protein